MAIKLPVRVVHDDHVVDVDGGFIALGDESYAAEIATALNAYPALGARVEELEGALRIYKAAVDDMQDLIEESGGVYGLHMNGDPSPWSELLEGGPFEDWLGSVSQASALSRKTGGETP